MHCGIFASLYISLAFIHRIAVATPNSPIGKYPKSLQGLGASAVGVFRSNHRSCLLPGTFSMEWVSTQEILYPPSATSGHVHFLFSVSLIEPGIS